MDKERRTQCKQSDLIVAANAIENLFMIVYKRQLRCVVVVVFFSFSIKFAYQLQLILDFIALFVFCIIDFARIHTKCESKRKLQL